MDYFSKLFSFIQQNNLDKDIDKFLDAKKDKAKEDISKHNFYYAATLGILFVPIILYVFPNIPNYTTYDFISKLIIFFITGGIMSSISNRIASKLMPSDIYYTFFPYKKIRENQNKEHIESIFNKITEEENQRKIFFYLDKIINLDEEFFHKNKKKVKKTQKEMAVLFEDFKKHITEEKQIESCNGLHNLLAHSITVSKNIRKESLEESENEMNAELLILANQKNASLEPGYNSNIINNPKNINKINKKGQKIKSEVSPYEELEKFL